MNLHQMISSFPWARYSKKLISKIERPKNIGFFTVEEAERCGMRLVIGEEGHPSEGNAIRLYLLIDESDAVIADAKFQAFGQSALIGAADAACDLLVRKNTDQARRLNAELLDKQLRDKSDLSAFPEATYPHLNLVLSAIENAIEQCMDIPFVEIVLSTPVEMEGMQECTEHPGWRTLSVPQKIAIIEEVIASEIRPYIELDAGGIQVINLIDGKEVVIAYQGACTSCHSATGSTLNAIEQILRAKVHPDLIVTPDLSFLTSHKVSEE